MNRTHHLPSLLLAAALTAAAAPAPRAADATIKMLTYNIKGHDNRTSTAVANIAAVINALAPDVVALQEVDNRTAIGKKYDNLADIAEATGMHSNFFALVGTYYGIGVLSRTEPLSVATQSFPYSDADKDKEDRGFIVAEFDDFFFLCTHYSLNADDRDTATAWAISFARQCGKTVFVAGDFNAKPTYRAMVTFQNNGFEILNDTSLPTYPSDAPESCIDMILRYADDTTVDFLTVDAGVPASAAGMALADVSDHLPAYAVVAKASSGIDSAPAGAARRAAAVAVYAPDGTRRQQPAPGINIVRRADGSAEKIFVK